MVLAAHEMYTTVLAQVGNPTPETPPAADKLLKMVRYFTWFVLLSGVTAVTYGGGKFAWEKWNGGSLESPKQVAGAMIGGATATSAGTIVNSVLGGGTIRWWEGPVCGGLSRERVISCATCPASG